MSTAARTNIELALPGYPEDYDGLKTTTDPREILTPPFGPANIVVLDRNSNPDFAKGADFHGLALAFKDIFNLGENGFKGLQWWELPFVAKRYAEKISDEAMAALKIIEQDLPKYQIQYLRVITGEGYDTTQGFYVPHIDPKQDYVSAFRRACCYYGSPTLGYRKDEVTITKEALTGEPSLQEAKPNKVEINPDARPFPFQLYDVQAFVSDGNSYGVDPFVHVATMDEIRIFACN